MRYTRAGRARRIVVVFCALLLPTGEGAGAPGPPGAAPPSIRLLRPVRADILSGTERLVARSTRRPTAVRFEWSPDRALWRPIGVDASRGRDSSTRWDTRVHHGKAWVRVVAHFGTETARDAVKVRVFNGSPNVRVKASPRRFSPNRDGAKDRTSIRVTTNKDAGVVIRVRGAGDRVLRKWRRRSRNGKVRLVQWNGRTSKGRRVGDGRYRIEAVVADEVGREDHGSTSVVADTRAPRITWKAFRPPRGRGGLSMTFTARDRSDPLSLKAIIHDRIAPLRSSKTIKRDAGKATLRYVPRYKNGKRFLPGTYAARVRARDRAGNVRVSTPRFWIVYRNVGARTYYRVPDPGRGVALTFDDCEFGDAWRSILKTLARYDAHATFFCPGRQVLANRELARATVRQGHTPGAHGWDHAWLSRMSSSSVASRLRRDEAAWRRATRVSSVPFFRPPYGASSSSVRAAAAATSHFRIIMWSVDPGDYSNPPPSSISSRVLARVRPGSIVVMHTRRNTAAALPTILRGLRSRSLRAESLAELFRN